jgi:HPt (histidine-containing phosphotransfer) domain-containing protein
MTIKFPQGILCGINVSEGLDRCMSDQHLYWAQLQQFSVKFSSAPRQLAALIEDRRWHEAERLSHSLKGTAGMLSVNDLQEAASRLNEDLKRACDTGAPPESVVPDLEWVRLEVERMNDGLQAIADGMK